MLGVRGEDGGCFVPPMPSRDRGLFVPAPGSPSFDVDGNRAQDAPTRSTEAHSRAEVKSAQKKSGARPEEDQKKNVKRAQKKRLNPAVYASFIPRVCKYLDQNAIGGGATPPSVQPLVRQKGGVSLL